MNCIPDKAEILLSYLVGMAPLGTPFAPRTTWLTTDLNCNRWNLYTRLNQLIRLGAVERLSAGSHRTFGVLVVRKRPEAFYVPPEPPPVEPEQPTLRHNLDAGRGGRAQRSDWFARLAEIPPDTRSLTGHVCGDPVFERSALFSSALRGAKANGSG
jgi:hypothetical protein